MADYGGAISLSQTRTSDDSSSEHSPPTLSTTPATAGGRGASTTTPSRSKTTKISIFDQTSPQTAVRKPRGRPPGSKNKPKPPIVITGDGNDCAMKPVVLEISAGSDIVETIVSFARRNHAGVTVISVSGTVAKVTLRHPVSHSPALSLHGPFSVLSLSGSFIGSSSKQTAAAFSSCFGVTLAGGQGQVFGGIVGGKVTAATTVVVVAATFPSPAVHRLPEEGERGDDEAEQQESKPGVGAAASESCSSVGLSMVSYGVASPNPISCQIPPDTWGPSSRPY